MLDKCSVQTSLHDVGYFVDSFIVLVARGAGIEENIDSVLGKTEMLRC